MEKALAGVRPAQMPEDTRRRLLDQLDRLPAERRSPAPRLLGWALAGAGAAAALAFGALHRPGTHGPAADPTSRPALGNASPAAAPLDRGSARGTVDRVRFEPVAELDRLQAVEDAGVAGLSDPLPVRRVILHFQKAYQWHPPDRAVQVRVFLPHQETLLLPVSGD